MADTAKEAGNARLLAAVARLNKRPALAKKILATGGLPGKKQRSNRRRENRRKKWTKDDVTWAQDVIYREYNAPEASPGRISRARRILGLNHCTEYEKLKLFKLNRDHIYVEMDEWLCNVDSIYVRAIKSVAENTEIVFGRLVLMLRHKLRII